MDWIKDHTHYTEYIVPFPINELVIYRGDMTIIVPGVFAKFKDL